MGLLKSAEFRQYILRKLGHDVINVEISEPQLDDAIDEAIKTYTEQHYDATSIGYIPLEVSAGVDRYTLAENVETVLEVLNKEGESSAFGSIIDEPLLWPRPFGYYAGSTCASSLAGHDLVNTEVFRQRYQMWEDQYSHPIVFEFSQITKEIYFPEAPENDGIRILKVYIGTAIDSEGNIHDSLWLKKYAVALAKFQWGHNISKYEGYQLPGGVSMNGEAIKSDAKEEIETLLEQLRDQYSFPPDPTFA